MKKLFAALAIVAAVSLTIYPVVPSLYARDAGIVQQVDYYDAADDSAPIIAALLSFLVPGLGQAFLGHIGRGIMIFVGLIVLYVAGAVVGYYIPVAGCILEIIALIVWIWQIGDAYKLALRKSRHHRRHRKNYDDEDDDEEYDDYDEDSLLTPHFTPAYVVTE